MKKIVVLLVLAIAAGSVGIFGQTKNDDIIKLLRISGSDKMADQMMTAMIPQFQQIVPGIPDVFWVKIVEKTNADDLIYMIVPIYSKHYTHDEIRQMIAFYESPIGRRLVEVTPFITQESMEVGQKWGEQLGHDIVNEMIREGYLR